MSIAGRVCIAWDWDAQQLELASQCIPTCPANRRSIPRFKHNLSVHAGLFDFFDVIVILCWQERNATRKALADEARQAINDTGVTAV